jgi:4-hydroxy-tetrahydrodipicolinate synthase
MKIWTATSSPIINEFLSGTVANDPMSVFKVTLIQVDPGLALLSWSSVDGKFYRTSFADNVEGPYTTYQDMISADPVGETTRPVPTRPQHQYYIVEVVTEESGPSQQKPALKIRNPGPNGGRFCGTIQRTIDAEADNMNRPQSLSGVVVPVLTPIDDRERVDEKAFRTQLGRLIAAGVHGLFVGGSAGQGPLFIMDQWQRMMEIAHDEVGGAIPLLAGVSDTSSQRICDKIGRVRDIGYEYFAITPTFYLAAASPAEHLRLFETCHDHAPEMEMVVYNIPSCVGCSIDIDLILQLARDGRIKCCKESSGEFDYLRPLVERGHKAGLNVLVGDERMIPSGLRMGGVGLIPVTANAYPELFVEIYNAAMANRADVLHLHRHIMNIREILLLRGTCWLGGLSFAVSRAGIGNGRTLSPLEPVGDEQKKLILDLLDRNPMK